MSVSLTEKLLADHRREVSSDGTMRLDVDQILIEDATGVMCALQFEQLDVPTVAVELAVMYVDHNVPYASFALAGLSDLASFSRRS
jgi:aconitate hydratase